MLLHCPVCHVLKGLKKGPFPLSRLPVPDVTGRLVIFTVPSCFSETGRALQDQNSKQLIKYQRRFTEYRQWHTYSLFSVKINFTFPRLCQLVLPHRVRVRDAVHLHWRQTCSMLIFSESSLNITQWMQSRRQVPSTCHVLFRLDSANCSTVRCYNASDATS